MLFNKMSLVEFRDEHLQKDVTFPNCDTNECMTLMHAYLKEVLNLEDPFTLAEPTAFDVWQKFPEVAGASHFEKIENNPSNFPVAGDVLFFEQNEVAKTGVAGHVCIVLEADTNRFTSFDANWGEDKMPHEVVHSYDGVVGWLHPVTASTPDTAQPDHTVYPYGLDLNNPDTVKVCVDTWKEVTEGKFVRKEEVDALTQKAAKLEAQLQQLQTAHAALPEQVRQDLISKFIAHLGL